MIQSTRFPEFELSYETMSQKKVGMEYSTCVAIPVGKKSFAWFTFDRDEDVCFLADLNREKRITQMNRVAGLDVSVELALGTVLYGTVLDEQDRQVFIVEDIYVYRGVVLKNIAFIEKLEMMISVLTTLQCSGSGSRSGSCSTVQFMLPVIWTGIGTEQPEAIGYPVHHIQYRSPKTIMPYLNVFTNKRVGDGAGSQIMVEKKVSAYRFQTMQFRMDTFKPQYRYPTVFHVTADIDYDIYHLYAFGKNNIPVYFDVAYIPNCKSSAFMNSLFRTIRENKNLDYIEESDDEDDFQNNCSAVVIRNPTLHAGDCGDWNPTLHPVIVVIRTPTPASREIDRFRKKKVTTTRNANPTASRFVRPRITASNL